MTFAQIRAMPTTFDIDTSHGCFHESLLRSFHIVEKVKELLSVGTPPLVIVEIVEDLQGERCTMKVNDLLRPAG